MTAREVVAIRPRNDSGPFLLCACGAVTLDYAPEERQGHVVHGALVCYQDGPAAPENCARCGAPINDANPTASGQCVPCEGYDAAEDPALAERRALMDWEDDR